MRRLMIGLGVLLLCAVLAVQVITRTLVAYLASVTPEAALALRPTDPAALLALAERQLESLAKQDAAGGLPELPAGGGSRVAAFAPRQAGRDREEGKEAGQLRQARHWAERALAEDPLNAAALRILGQLASIAGEPDRAAMLMEAAARLSLHESQAVASVMENRLAAGDFASGLQLADVLLRTRPDLVALLAPLIARSAEADAARPHLDRLLAADPPWRAAALSLLPEHVADAGVPLGLLLDLKRSARPPTTAEIRPYLEHLVRSGRHELAHYAWLQLIPAEQLARAGLLFNGDFRDDPSGMPFDWEIAPGPGSSIGIQAHPDHLGQRALAIGLGPGRVELGRVRQITVLPVGDYRLHGSCKARLIGRRGLRWRVACAGAGAALGESDMILDTGPGWKELDLPFTVPAAGCRAQVVELILDARSPSEQLVSGTASCAGLAIAHRR